MDDARYGELLGSIRPVLIETAEEHDRMLTAAEELMEKGASLSAEEQRALELLVFLIKSFEDSVMSEEEDADEEEAEQVSARPYETLRRLLDARGMGDSDVEHVFGNPSACREALAGMRKISRGQAKALADLFRVPYKLFVE